MLGFHRTLVLCLLVTLSVLWTACGDDGSARSTDASELEIADREVLAETGEPDVPAVVPPRPLNTLAYPRPARTDIAPPPTEAQIAAFTETLSSFFTETGYFDWAWRNTHGLDASYDPDMMDYRIWWQDVGMRREGDAVVFYHHGRAENVAERTVKVLPNLIGGYLATGNQRLADLSTQLLKGMVALSLGLEFEREDPIVKYLQARAVFNHDHSYEVDGRPVTIDYSGSCKPWAQWNVHIFEIPDNPTYGDIWVSNMRSKDDVAFIIPTVTMATRAYYESEDPDLKAAALLFLEYIRGFCQNIVDSDWFIMTKYEDGVTQRQYNVDRSGDPPVDAGSFVHWETLIGPDGECNGQLGVALTATGGDLGKGDCGRGLAGEVLEHIAFTTHFFNYENYVTFHIGALAAATLWRHDAAAEALMSGLVDRFEAMLHDPDMPNRDSSYYNSGLAGWLLVAAAHGYPLSTDEAHHVMEWYGRSADWHRGWAHWDPWSSLADGEDIPNDKSPNLEYVTNGDGSEQEIAYIRLMEMPYIFEYCASPVRDKDGVQFVDCEVILNVLR